MADSIGTPPRLLVRLEHNELNFARAAAEHCDAVVLAAAFDAPYWPDSGESAKGKTGSELKATVLGARVPYRIDLETWKLLELRHHEDRELGRFALTACAQAVALPVTPATFADDDALRALVTAAVRTQAGAELTYAPDFPIGAIADPWGAVNIRALRLTAQLLGRPPAAWIHLTPDALAAGVLPYLAERYRAVLGPGAHVTLSVATLNSDAAPELLLAFAAGVGALRAAGLQIDLDRPAELGVLGAALGTRGVILGNRVYRTMPPTGLWTTEINPKIRVRYYDARRHQLVPRNKVPGRRANGRRNAIPYCPVERCVAHRLSEPKLAVRCHNAHAYRADLARAGAIGPSALVSELRRLGLARYTRWADALDAAIRRIEEA
jgi:hypothetical protein